MIPFGRVEAVSGKALRALDVRARGLAELPRGDDQHIGLVARTAGGLHVPAAALRIPRTGGHGCIGLDQAVDSVCARDGVEVGTDLRLRRAQPRPVAPLREGERVQVTGHVARGAGVAVVEPRAAERGSLLEDLDVRDPTSAQLDRGGDPAEARAHDQHRERAARGLLWTGRYGGHATPPPRARIFWVNLMPGAAQMSRAATWPRVGSPWDRCGARPVTRCSRPAGPRRAAGSRPRARAPPGSPGPASRAR